MTQNTSSAVMQQRTEAHDSLDDFPTPSWATRALIEHVLLSDIRPHLTRPMLQRMTCWEPACNRGYMVRPLREYFGEVVGTDIHAYDPNFYVTDFLMPMTEPLRFVTGTEPVWIISNPPFRLAKEFIDRARQIPGWQGTAMLVRTSFLEGVGRYADLFKDNRPDIVAQFSERVPMVKGRMSAKAVTATSYCWMVWTSERTWNLTRLIWIPPCRRQLERPGDYPNV
jgi:hypothetical protein